MKLDYLLQRLRAGFGIDSSLGHKLAQIPASLRKRCVRHHEAHPPSITPYKIRSAPANHGPNENIGVQNDQSRRAFRFSFIFSSRSSSNSSSVTPAASMAA